MQILVHIPTKSWTQLVRVQLSANNWMRHMFDVGNDNADVVANVSDRNDELPYPQVIILEDKLKCLVYRFMICQYLFEF